MLRRQFLGAMALRAIALRTMAAGSVGLVAGHRSASGAAKFQSDRVIVIGAGISGLAAARRLVTEYGFSAPGQVVILEGRDRIGGRVFTDRSLGHPVDLGANWIHGVSGNPIKALAAAAGAKLKKTKYGTIRIHDLDGAAVSKKKANKLYDQFAGWRKALLAGKKGLPGDLSMAAMLDSLGGFDDVSGLKERLLRWHWFWEVELDATARLDQLSTLAYDEDGAFGGPDKLFPSGTDQILEPLQDGLDVRLEHVVSAVDHSGSTVKVQTDQGLFEAERCVITLPLGVLKAGSVNFSPGLPPAVNLALGRLGVGSAIKFALLFDQIHWSKKKHFFGKISANPGDDVEFLNLAANSKRPMLLMEANQDRASALEAMGETAAAAEIMTDLRAMFGPDLPDPTGVVGSTWGASPFTAGSYSYRAVGSSESDNQAFAAPVNGRLFFAGEHTSVTYPSTLHGAYLSGRKAAKRIQAAVG